MNRQADVIHAVATYDQRINGDNHAEMYRIEGQQPVTYGVTLYTLRIEYDTHTTTTAAISYDYAGTVMAISDLRPAYITPDDIEFASWTECHTGKQAHIIYGLPRI